MVGGQGQGGDLADGERARVDSALAEFLAAETAQLTTIDPALAPVAWQLTAAVVHDDVIDKSATGRHAPAAHVALRDAVFDQRSRDGGGTALAIIAGGLLVSWAGQLFFGCGLPDSFLRRARPLWFTMARELAAIPEPAAAALAELVPALTTLAG
jgi:geranylgeranyl diphosphate synthase, type I